VCGTRSGKYATAAADRERAYWERVLGARTFLRGPRPVRPAGVLMSARARQLEKWPTKEALGLNSKRLMTGVESSTLRLSLAKNAG
jgi:hypothetical protein